MECPNCKIKLESEKQILHFLWGTVCVYCFQEQADKIFKHREYSFSPRMK